MVQWELPLQGPRRGVLLFDNGRPDGDAGLEFDTERLWKYYGSVEMRTAIEGYAVGHKVPVLWHAAAPNAVGFCIVEISAASIAAAAIEAAEAAAAMTARAARVAKSYR